uniref:Secreted protein n=1 Tax=Paramormyrops kingsleyae TaxID=1676925 RepID=A0A3B3T4B4_9TELE
MYVCLFLCVCFLVSVSILCLCLSSCVCAHVPPRLQTSWNWCYTLYLKWLKSSSHMNGSVAGAAVVSFCHCIRPSVIASTWEPFRNRPLPHF